MPIKILANGRIAITETFKAVIPEMPNQHSWQDGADWEQDYPGSKDFLVLCSPVYDPLAQIRKDATQEEVDAFLFQQFCTPG